MKWFKPKEQKGSLRVWLGALTTIIVVVVVTFGLIVPMVNLSTTTASVGAAVSFLNQLGYTVLAAGESIVGDLLPSDNNTYDIGSTTKRWAEGWFNTLTGTTLNAPTGRGATYVVAASNAPAHVKAQADYVCDGAIDNVEIQAAIDSLSASFPGVVHLSSGYFYLGDTINLNKNSAILEGEGNASILYLSNNINKDIVNISQGWCVLRDVRVAGNKANNLTNGSGVVFTNAAAFCTIERVWSVDNREYGFKCTNAGQPTWLNYCNRFEWCRATENGSHGWYLCGLGGHKLISCESGQNVGDGYYIFTTEVFLTLCNADSNSGYGFIFLSGGYHALTGFRATSNGKNGICFQNDAYNTISNGQLYNNGQLSYSYAEFLIAASRNNSISNLTIHTNTEALGGVSNYSFAIQCATSGYSNIIKGCTMRNDRTGGGGSNGIILDDDSAGNIINNIFEGNQVLAVTPLVLGGTVTVAANKFKNNVGIVTENSGTATMLINTGAIAVSHGLATTPTRVIATMTSNPGLAVSTWMDTYGTTQFTIHTSENVTVATTFDWRAVAGEGN